jgi:hypothetical protein
VEPKFLTVRSAVEFGHVQEESMISISRPLVLAVVLAGAPLTSVLAQGNPAGNMGSNTSITATPGTADNKALSGMNTADATAMPARPPSSAATNAYVPGATGKTIVPGSTSSPAAAAAGTAEAKTGGGGGGGQK